MAFKHKVRSVQAAIPTASMADIAFLLIIFFMVTTKFHVDKTTVDLPKSELRTELPPDAAFVVVYQPDNSVDYSYKFSDGKQQSFPVDVGNLEIQINTITSVDPGIPFVVKADGKTPYEYIDDTIEILRRGGVEQVVLLTDQLTVEDQ